jgi:fused signal recognition particle receptor
MSPYQQGVTDIALREARRQGDILKQQGALGAIGRGTFGGARQALLQAEQERGIQQNLADIQTKGSQSAYENSQRQFLADQANRMAAQQLNVQSGLQAGLSNQQMQQQANVQNLASYLQTQGLSADQAMKAAMANQQAQQTTQQQNLAALLGVQQLGSGQSLESQKANQAAALQAQQLAQQGQQYAAGLGKDVGLAGLSSTLEGSKALGALGATQQQTNLELLKAKAATAEEKQALDQQIKDLQYQKFQEQQNYQRSLLEYYGNILRGNAGALGSSQVAYTPAPSMASQIGGLGLAGLGLANVLGRG